MTRHSKPTSARTHRFLLGVASVLAAAYLVLVVGPSPASAATSHHVTIASYAYSPSPLTIADGDTVTWTNTDSVAHDVTVTSGPSMFQSPMLAKGQSWSYTFTTQGTYSYICSVHPDMRATVTVAAPPAIAKAAPVPPRQHSMQTQVVTVPAHSPLQKSAPRATTAAAATAPAAAPPSPGNPTLSPLLIVAGCAAGAMVFCLLLLASRPAAAADR